jgi:hypothetical protein
MGSDASREGIVEFPCDVERLENGNTLISDAGDEAGNGSEIVEVTPDGDIAWRYGEGLRFAHSAKRLAGGNTLIADTTNDRVIEVTPGGEVVFTTDELGGGTGELSDGSHLEYPNDAHLLGSGNILITDRNNDRALEITREGEVAWAYAGKVKRPHNADLLENGNVIICDSDGQYIREVDRDGGVVWSYGDGTTDTLNWPRDADRLENGNTLITDTKGRRVLEVTPDGKTVWQYNAGYFCNFYDADRLPNGNTLVSSQQHQEVIEITPLGEIAWSFRNYTRPYPINEKLLNGDFSETGESGGPAHWVVGRRLSEGGGELTWGETPSGTRCPGLSYDRSGALTLQQTIAAVPGSRLRLSALMSTEDLEGLSFMQVAFLDDMNGFVRDVVESPKSSPFEGTMPWSQVSFTADVPDGAAAAEVRLFVMGKGRAYANNVSVEVVQ